MSTPAVLKIMCAFAIFCSMLELPEMDSMKLVNNQHTYRYGNDIKEQMKYTGFNCLPV
jgi:hypothetical protein